SPLVGPISQGASGVGRETAGAAQGSAASTRLVSRPAIRHSSSNNNRSARPRRRDPKESNKGKQREVGMHDIVIRGGTIIDGTGKAAFTGDVAIAGGKISAV